MIKIQSEIIVSGITSQEIFNFMLNCKDEDYQAWWPGTHLKWHTTERYPGDVGNLVYFEEIVGNHRLKFNGIVTEVVPYEKLEWQMIKGFRLPAWLTIEFNEQQDTVQILHSLIIDLKGIGRIFEPLLSVIFKGHVATELDLHAQTEFPMLAELLISRRGN